MSLGKTNPSLNSQDCRDNVVSLGKTKPSLNSQHSRDNVVSSGKTKPSLNSQDCRDNVVSLGKTNPSLNSQDYSRDNAVRLGKMAKLETPNLQFSSFSEINVSQSNSQEGNRYE